MAGSERDKGGGPGKDDGVDVYPADGHDLQTYRDANAQLGQMRVPQLIDSHNPNQKLYVAVLDGTGNDMFTADTAHQTSVARIYQDLRNQHNSGELPNVAAGYVTGPGTQGGLKGTWDGAKGHTFEERAETMYKMFIEQSADWLKRNPDADIKVAAIGFSRGAEQAAFFTRLVEERGIQDPTGAKYTYDNNGLVSGVQYNKPPLVEPGKVAQAVMLHDPVGTGNPLDYDRRLPPSVVSGVQIFAEDERRNLFKGSEHLPRANGANTLSEDGRFLNVTVGGAHSDIGGAYPMKGLGTLSENLARDYINGLSDKPILARQQEPADPKQYVVHRSEQHQWFYRTSEFDRAGERQTNPNLAPNTVHNVDRTHKEPINEALSAQFQYRQIPTFPITGPAAQTQAQEPRQGAMAPPISPATQPLFERLATGAQNNDPTVVREVAAQFLQTTGAQTWLQQGREANQQLSQPQQAPPIPSQEPQVVEPRSAGMRQ
jgi:hypothetical protein